MVRRRLTRLDGVTAVELARFWSGPSPPAFA
jgi:hypothetical protein